ncbi:hypothetical protein AB0I61_01335 [Polymorphospora rubra]|uniref:hypothetical protein n=1 Tax=Polymorphospora rubra TaxID=338584 RepID=UPI0033F7DE17
MAGHAGVTWERVDAEDGVLRPGPSVDRRGTSRLSGTHLAGARRPPAGRPPNDPSTDTGRMTATAGGDATGGPAATR